MNATSRSLASPCGRRGAIGHCRLLDGVARARSRPLWRPELRSGSKVWTVSHGRAQGQTGGHRWALISSDPTHRWLAGRFPERAELLSSPQPCRGLCSSPPRTSCVVRLLPRGTHTCRPCPGPPALSRGLGGGPAPVHSSSRKTGATPKGVLRSL